MKRRANKKHQLQQWERERWCQDQRREKILLWMMEVHTMSRFSPDWNIQSNKAMKFAWNLFDSSSEHNYSNRARQVLPWLYWVTEKKAGVVKDFCCVCLGGEGERMLFYHSNHGIRENPTNCNCYCSWQIHHTGTNRLLYAFFVIAINATRWIGFKKLWNSRERG